ALYPKERYPLGHPLLAPSFNSLGGLLRAQGNYEEARQYYERALEMLRGLYPQARYPQGHPYLAFGLSNMGDLLQTEGKYTEAWPFLIQAADIAHDLAEVFLAATSEAEALDYMAQLPKVRNNLISTSLHLPESSEAAYARVWRGKAAVARTLQHRQAVLVDLAKNDPATRQTLEAWQQCRRQLARLLRAPANPNRPKAPKRPPPEEGAAGPPPARAPPRVRPPAEARSEPPHPAARGPPRPHGRARSGPVHPVRAGPPGQGQERRTPHAQLCGL